MYEIGVPVVTNTEGSGGVEALGGGEAVLLEPEEEVRAFFLLSESSAFIRGRGKISVKFLGLEAEEMGRGGGVGAELLLMPEEEEEALLLTTVEVVANVF